MNEIDQEKIAEKYNNTDEIWSPEDKWHFCTRHWIEKFIERSKEKMVLPDSAEILNAGSGGESYGFEDKQTIHMDIAEKKIEKFPRKIIGSVETIPLANNCIDLAFCVGSVINYCDPLPVIRELSRVLRKKGYLILEFENTHSLEFVFKRSFNKQRFFSKTFYKGEEEFIWIYAEKFIRQHLIINNFTPIATSRCHLISPLIYRITENSNYAAKFEKWDKLVRKLPFFSKFSSNVIILLEKS